MSNPKLDIETFKNQLDLYGNDMSLDEFKGRKAGRIDALEMIRDQMNNLPDRVREEASVKQLYFFILGYLSDDIEEVL